MIFRDARSLKFDSSQPVFFDTNVWLAIFPATSCETKKDWAVEYSGLYARLTKYKVPIVTNAMVMSEYLNRFCRIEHEAYCKAYGNIEYKDYRNGKDFVYAAAAASEYAKEILDTGSLQMKGIDPDIDSRGIVEKFASGTVDYNDAVYVELCQKNKWPIVTHDSDFAYGGTELEVWTANNTLLNLARRRGQFKSR